MFLLSLLALIFQGKYEDYRCMSHADKEIARMKREYHVYNFWEK